MESELKSAFFCHIYKFLKGLFKGAEPVVVESEPDSFTIRIRFRLPSSRKLNSEETELSLEPFDGHPIILKSSSKPTPIGKCNWLIIVCSDWESEASAESAIEFLLDRLKRGLASIKIGADFGDRAPKSGFFKAGLNWIEEKTGRRTINDVHGPMVYQASPQPLFANAGTARGTISMSEERWRSVLVKSLKVGSPLNERERTSFELFSSAMDIDISVDAKFALYFAAIETLLENKPKSSAAVELIEQMREMTKESTLDKAEKEQIRGSLNWIKNHSIRQSGQMLVGGKLSGRKYNDKSPEKFFLECYEMRNRLLHGLLPYPTRDEVAELVNQLELMVSHLLAEPDLLSKT